ncbi:MAG: FemAB family XrtA/PEP-CTERM system-associated protein [bacterium]
MSLQIHELNIEGTAEWDAFVNNTQGGTFFHLAGWKRVLEQAFGHRTFYLFAKKNGEIVGILPLGLINSRLFGKSLSSLPFCAYGGIVSSDTEGEKALREEACRLARKFGVGALELRNCRESDTGWPGKDLYCTFRKAIVDDDDANMGAIPSKQRTMIRKGVRNGLQAEFCSEPDRVYRVYSESVRNLGTPVFAKSYFDVLMEVFGDSCSTMMVVHEGRDVAGVLSFYFKDQVLPYYGGSIAEARKIKGVNDFMYWELMRNSARRGCRLFDFGRSKVGTGPYKFKRNWGFDPEPLHYEYFLVNSQVVPNVSPNNPKYKKFIRAWQRLPVPIANRIGPMLAKSLG